MATNEEEMGPGALPLPRPAAARTTASNSGAAIDRIMDKVAGGMRAPLPGQTLGPQDRPTDHWQKPYIVPTGIPGQTRSTYQGAGTTRLPNLTGTLYPTAGFDEYAAGTPEAIPGSVRAKRDAMTGRASAQVNEYFRQSPPQWKDSPLPQIASGDPTLKANDGRYFSKGGDYTPRYQRENYPPDLRPSGPGGTTPLYRPLPGSQEALDLSRPLTPARAAQADRVAGAFPPSLAFMEKQRVENIKNNAVGLPTDSTRPNFVSYQHQQTWENAQREGDRRVAAAEQQAEQELLANDIAAGVNDAPGGALSIPASAQRDYTVNIIRGTTPSWVTFSSEHGGKPGLNAAGDPVNIEYGSGFVGGQMGDATRHKQALELEGTKNAGGVAEENARSAGMLRVEQERSRSAKATADSSKMTPEERKEAQAIKDRDVMLEAYNAALKNYELASQNYITPEDGTPFEQSKIAKDIRAVMDAARTKLSKYAGLETMAPETETAAERRARLLGE